MKKWGSLICGMMLGILSVFGKVYAETPNNEVCREIIDKVVERSEKLEFDKDYDMSLTEKFGEELLCKPLSAIRSNHYSCINKLLADGTAATYDCRVWSDWMFCELRNHNIECEQITVTVGNDLKKHFAILIPQIEKGTKKWYVCDMFLTNKFANDRSFLFKPLEEYFGELRYSFKGAMVNDGDFVCFSPSGIGSIGGRDIYAWLIENGGNSGLVDDIIRRRGTLDVKFMSSLKHFESDYHILRSRIEELKIPYSYVSYVPLKV